MHRLLVAFLFVAAISSHAFAEKVGVSDAEIVARNFLLQQRVTGQNKLPALSSATIMKSTVLRSNQGNEIAYVFEMTPYGFIVTSNDNAYPPILAYSRQY